MVYISGYPLATGRAQDKESSPAKDRRSTAVPRDQPTNERRIWYTVDKTNCTMPLSYEHSRPIFSFCSLAHSTAQWS